jgi:hypothetical protein
MMFHPEGNLLKSMQNMLESMYKIKKAGLFSLFL